MRRASLRLVVVVVCVLVHLAAGASMAVGLVRCSARNHVAIEWAGGDCCAAHHPGDPHGASLERSCCSDAPLATSMLACPTDRVHSAAIAVPFVRCLPAAVAPREHARAADLDRSAASRLARHSVVLRV